MRLVKKKMQNNADLLKLGDRIKEIRSKSGLNQEQFALQVGISVRALGYYEANEQEPGAAVLEKIIFFAEEKEIIYDARWLLAGEGTPIADEGRVKLIPSEGKEMRIESLKNAAEKILRSDSPFAEALAHNIDTFAVGLDLWEKKEAHHPLQNPREGET
jgi:transcriptional regulator with XRE-family HTH domain